MNTLTGKSNVFFLTATAVLIAIGTVIPMFAPRVVIEPASYTLASHVAIFIAMFISPKVAVGVAVGTTLGFLFAGFPPAIVLRAMTHVFWAFPGALYLARIDKFNISFLKLRAFSFVVGVVHALLEVIVVVLFFFGTGFPEGQGLGWVFLFIGVGTVIHSMVDLEIANVVRHALQTQKSYRDLAGNK
ncbi:MAG: hypothetical protein FWB96_01715 [Defluviitaleaceae bacterium]|nr:hypothetical protein [Defluviitaleaceae bacterium]MCL2261590.1 hypothetical protein [Defluviitaleaceae bacterium]